MIYHVTITIIRLTDTSHTTSSSVATYYDDSDDWDDSELRWQMKPQSEPKEILTTEEVLKLRGGKL